MLIFPYILVETQQRCDWVISPWAATAVSGGCLCPKATPYRCPGHSPQPAPAYLWLHAISHAIIWDEPFFTWKAKHFSLNFLFHYLLKVAVWPLHVFGSHSLSLLRLRLQPLSQAENILVKHNYFIFLFIFQKEKKKKMRVYSKGTKHSLKNNLQTFLN